MSTDWKSRALERLAFENDRAPLWLALPEPDRVRLAIFHEENLSIQLSDFLKKIVQNLPFATGEIIYNPSWQEPDEKYFILWFRRELFSMETSHLIYAGGLEDLQTSPERKKRLWHKLQELAAH